MRSGGIGSNEGIACRPDGADEARVFGVVAEFASQGRDVDVYGAVEDLVVAFADFLEKCLAGSDASDGAAEREEEVKFDGGESERVLLEGGRAGVWVDGEGADLDGGVGLGSLGNA
ncbi:MAG: hypothetical protein RLZZ399_2559 [Verrucomicrobiota bacterium]